MQLPSVPSISKKLIEDADGIWTIPRTSSVSYPDEGNSLCFELETSSYWFCHRNDVITAITNNYPPDGWILDVGGGNGYVASRLAVEGFPTIVLEPGSTGAHNAKTKRNITTVICAPLEDVDFAPLSIPAIGLFDVMEHIQDDKGFVNTLFDILKPGGMLYMTVPAHQWLWSMSDITAQHYRRYSREMLYDLLSDRFDILYNSYFFGALTIPLFFLRRLPFMLGLVKKKAVVSAMEHGNDSGIVFGLVMKILSNETKQILHKRTLSTGTSCILVAAKKTV